MKFLMAACAAIALALIALVPAERPVLAQSAEQCTTETLLKANVGSDTVDTYVIQQDGGKSAFVRQGSIRKADLDDTTQVMACGKYARLDLKGKRYFIRRTSYRTTCTCNAEQLRDAAAPGAGNLRMCPKASCPAN